MKYDNPFPGMNPYLEHRHIWPDFHDGLISNLRDRLVPQLPDNYRIALQRRVEIEEPFGQSLGLRAIVPDALITGEPVAPQAAAAVTAPPADDGEEIPEGAVRVRMPREVKVNWLRVETVPGHELVTIIEVLSPTNKAPGRERLRYVRKREVIIGNGVNLVEIDLLRRWEPMPLEAALPTSDYRILVCRGWQRPDALLYPFSVKQALPKFPLPLLPEDEVGPEVDLGPIIDRLHHTARYNQETRYHGPPPEPAFEEKVQAWVGERVAGFAPAA